MLTDVSGLRSHRCTIIASISPRPLLVGETRWRVSALDKGHKRQPLRGSPHFVRLGLDGLRSLPHSVTMIDTSVRGRLAPRASPRANLDRRAHGHGRAPRSTRKTNRLSFRRLEFGHGDRVGVTSPEPQNRAGERLGRRRRSLQNGPSIALTAEHAAARWWPIDQPIRLKLTAL